MANHSTTRRLASVLALSLALAAATPPEAPVADAAQSGDIAQVRTLLQQGADVNAAQADGLTALHWAAANGHVVIIQFLVSSCAESRLPQMLNAQSSTGLTPLMLASSEGYPEAARLLEALGADLAMVDCQGRTAREMAQDSAETSDDEAQE